MTNLQFALDILVNGRMYAAQFEELNDPMEGSYLYEPGVIDRHFVRELYGQKAQWRIVSLSATPYDMLMWTYYAEAHSGFVIGAQLDDRNVQVETVEYVPDLSLELNHRNVALRILCKKLAPWKHEEEHRAFVQNQSFIKVKVREVIFGIHTTPDRRELVTKIAKKYWPRVQIRSLQRGDLQVGHARQVHWGQTHPSQVRRLKRAFMPT